ncbi:hypothetical protein COV19_02045 [Candidatus Woesearchaeota archaeon CG10_big_fil_rev_8_21_14_0_10_44_13]|nr:MAG: hypothetical protein COV19_02045 [Candidatus Woesearchaeota archaeon CG10_big_fil_rev_8_21_14_0_10_44_13]
MFLLISYFKNISGGTTFRTRDGYAHLEGNAKWGVYFVKPHDLHFIRRVPNEVRIPSLMAVSMAKNTVRVPLPPYPLLHRAGQESSRERSVEQVKVVPQ